MIIIRGNVFLFGTKAETLEALNTAERNFIILPFLYFTKEEWQSSSEGLLDKIQSQFVGKKLAVRSSAVGEDGGNASLAGAYESILNVDSLSRDRVAEAVGEVFASYPDTNGGGDQVLIQEMAHDISVTGVIMTRMVDDGSPYYVFNYDEESTMTDTVTGGTGVHKAVLVYRGAEEADCDSPRLWTMLNLARELEEICESNTLDIEFSLNRHGEVYLYQVRRIATTGHWRPDCQLPVSRRMPQIENFVRNLSEKRVGLYGDRTILGNMPDWNPAEIIGTRPAPLAESLYRYIITSETWHRAREKMGYRALPKTDLMVLVAGSPYIDVRASFNSFLPRGVAPSISEKLVSSWLDRLEEHPELHDKVEFDIVPTVYDLDFPSKFDELYAGLLSYSEKEEYAGLLHALTSKAIDPGGQGSLTEALNSVADLKALQESSSFSAPLEAGPVSLAAWISATLSDCIRLGTLPFSIVARHGFIAESFFRSMVRLGVISQERVQLFKNSFPTILGELSADTVAVNEGKISHEVFFERYGHLRPGTYDIMARSYRERKNLFSNSTAKGHGVEYGEFVLSETERDRIDSAFAESGFDSVTADRFFEYARMAIAGREYAKFIFTKSLSAVIDAVIDWGKFYNLGREELSLLRIEDILDTAVNSTRDDPTNLLIHKIDRSRLETKSDGLVKMGYLIRGVKDLRIVPIHRSSPNFVGSERVEGQTVFLESYSEADTNIQGKIVCIENADPGFDWVFSKKIAGLITKYGGANSHMAIRCAEMRLPAAIGCGELIFSSLSDGDNVVLSCKDKVILT